MEKGAEPGVVRARVVVARRSARTGTGSEGMRGVCWKEEMDLVADEWGKRGRSGGGCVGRMRSRRSIWERRNGGISLGRDKGDLSGGWLGLVGWLAGWNA